MNLASKLGEDIADGGETLLTAAAHDAAAPSLVRRYEPMRTTVSGLELRFYRSRTIRQ
jgi:hypothetical protein